MSPQQMGQGLGVHGGQADPLGFQPPQDQSDHQVPPRDHSRGAPDRSGIGQDFDLDPADTSLDEAGPQGAPIHLPGQVRVHPEVQGGHPGRPDQQEGQDQTRAQNCPERHRIDGNGPFRGDQSSSSLTRSPKGPSLGSSIRKTQPAPISLSTVRSPP